MKAKKKINKALNKKRALEDTLEQVLSKLNTMKMESKNTVKMLKEEIQKLDDLYQQTVKITS